MTLSGWLLQAHRPVLKRPAGVTCFLGYVPLSGCVGIGCSEAIRHQNAWIREASSTSFPSRRFLIEHNMGTTLTVISSENNSASLKYYVECLDDGKEYSKEEKASCETHRARHREDLLPVSLLTERPRFPTLQSCMPFRGYAVSPLDHTAFSAPTRTIEMPSPPFHENPYLGASAELSICFHDASGLRYC